MLDDLAYNWKLRRLQSRKKRIDAENDKRVEAARKERNDHGEIQYLLWEGQNDLVDMDDAILTLQGRYLTEKAEKYLLPTPPYSTESGDWEETEVLGLWRLALPAQAELRKAIHDYEKERRERFQSWLIALSGFIGAMTGLIGVLIGLIAIWPSSP